MNQHYRIPTLTYGQAHIPVTVTVAKIRYRRPWRSGTAARHLRATAIDLTVDEAVLRRGLEQACTCRRRRGAGHMNPLRASGSARPVSGAQSGCIKHG
jgi:hypothetical protein